MNQPLLYSCNAHACLTSINRFQYIKDNLKRTVISVMGKMVSGGGGDSFLQLEAGELEFTYLIIESSSSSSSNNKKTKNQVALKKFENGFVRSGGISKKRKGSGKEKKILRTGHRRDKGGRVNEFRKIEFNRWFFIWFI